MRGATHRGGRVMGEHSWIGWLAPSGDGVSWSSVTPALGVALAVVWLLSARLVASGRDWREIPTTLFGWSWIGFGLLFTVRFWILSLDAVTYGDPGGRLLRVDESVIDRALLLAGAYWICVCLGYLVVQAPKLNPLAVLSRAFRAPSPAALDALAVITTGAIVASNLVEVPDGLQRPLGLVGALWPCAAASAWGMAARREGSPSAFALRRWLYLGPGVINFCLQPYREGLLAVVMLPFLAALLAGRRVRLGRTLIFLLLFGVASTVGVSTYRLVTWEGREVTEAARQVDPGAWRAEPWSSPAAALLRRFHSFDSLMIYVDLVPELVPFDAGNPLRDFLVEAFLPRALYANKPGSERARAFSGELWTYGIKDRFEANIAPSMAGHLYGAGGTRWVIAGGMVWGFLLGLIDRWAMRLAPTARLVLLASLCLLASGGIERDFPRAAATLVQGLLALVAAAIVMPRRAAAQRDAQLFAGHAIGTAWRRVARPH